MPTGPLATGRWAIAGPALVIAAYAVASHWLLAHWPDRPWTVALMFGPVVIAVLAAAWHRRHVGLGAAALGGVALLAWVVARGGVTDIERLYVLQHAALHAVLAATFGLTLRPGATPLITAVASRVHRQFTPAMAAYTRRVTAAWAAYFVAMIALSLALYALAPWGVWSLFGTLITPAAAVAFFLGELMWRRWRHPEFERVTAVEAWQAYQRHQADAQAAAVAAARQEPR